MAGTVFFYMLQKTLKLRTRTMYVILTLMNVLIPLYGLLGFFAPFGLRNRSEFLLLQVFYGFLSGAIWAQGRNFLSEIIPIGHENEFYSIYEITDNGTSWLGPLLVAAVQNWTHELRYTLIVIFFMLLAPALIVLFGVNVEKGKKQSEEYAEMCDKK